MYEFCEYWYYRLVYCYCDRISSLIYLLNDSEKMADQKAKRTWHIVYRLIFVLVFAGWIFVLLPSSVRFVYHGVYNTQDTYWPNELITMKSDRTVKIASALNGSDKLFCTPLWWEESLIWSASWSNKKALPKGRILTVPRPYDGKTNNVTSTCRLKSVVCVDFIVNHCQDEVWTDEFVIEGWRSSLSINIQ